MKAAGRAVVSAFLWALFLWTASAVPQKPEPPRLVNDFAGLLDSRQALRLERMLTAFDDSTSNQIAVVTVKDLEGMSATEYAVRTGLDWQVGSSRNNGIIVLVKPKTSSSSGEAAISVGYGLEGAIPDAYCKRIIENEMIPYFREDDYAGGIEAACVTLMKLASGEISEPREYDEDGLAEIIAAIFIIICIIAFAVIVVSNQKGGKGPGSSGGDISGPIFMGNVFGGGHGSSSWGGFSGGGFGGFGGFGGGSFGGGGASGRW